MKHTKRQEALWQASLATLITAGAIALCSGPATAYVACIRAGDCWHTDNPCSPSPCSVGGHSDQWWDRRKSDTHYHWHGADRRQFS